jgi:hypothetical protein
MGRDTESESRGWWQTLPGLLTAAAAAITALTGLLIAAHQIGCLNRNFPAASRTQSHPVGDGSPSIEGQGATSSPANSPAPRRLALPATTEVRSGELVYKLVSARLSSYAPGKVSLRLAVRMTNNGRFDANFWAASFRLWVDESLQAPVNDLNEIVAPHSANDGEVEFVIPDNVSTVGLQMGDVGEGKPTLYLDLQHPNP